MVLAENCLPEIKKNCPTKKKCTADDYEKKREVIFLDMNFSYCEVEELRCQASQNCEKFTVIPEIDQQKVLAFNKRLRNNKNHSPALIALSKKNNCRSTEIGQIRSCLRDIVLNEQLNKNIKNEMIHELFSGVLKDEDVIFPTIESMIEKYPHLENEVDEYIEEAMKSEPIRLNFKQRLKDSSEQLKPNLNNSLIISGHSKGDSIWGGDGEILYFLEISKNLTRENIQSVFFSACSTGRQDALKREMTICGPIPPGRIYGINGTSPSNSLYSARGLSHLLEIDEKLAKLSDVKKIQSIFDKNLLKMEDPIMLMCSDEGYKTFELGKNEDFDPNQDCGLASERLRICLSKIFNDYGEELEQACHFKELNNFGNRDVGFSLAKKYLAKNIGLIKKLTPLNQFFEPKPLENWSEENYQQPNSNEAKVFFEVVYRLANTDAACLKKIDGGLQVTDQTALLNFFYQNRLINIKDNVLLRFDSEIGVDGKFNQYMEELNQTNCFKSEPIKKISKNTFMDRINIGNFVLDLQNVIDQIEECSDFPTSTKWEKLKSDSKKMITLVDRLARHYVLRADTNYRGCRPLDIIYSEELLFDSTGRELTQFQTDQKLNEVECLISP